MAEQTILVVDDSPTIQKIMAREISPARYNVLTASSGMEALSILEWADTLPNVITLDIDMPGLNGFEVCRYIQAGAQQENLRKQQIAQIPIIFISARDTLENREEGYELGVVDFISKPFPQGKILNTIRKILNADEQFDGMTALIVDDSPLARRIVRNILSRHGLKIYEAGSGEEGLSYIKKQSHEIDIIITDYIMPGISGEELCSNVRQLEHMAQVPVFFISAIERKSTVLSFFHAGANDYLPKPFIEEEFRARVIPHLRNRLYLKELKALNSKLKYTAERDALTRLFNRGYFQKEGDAAFTHAQISEQPLSYILIDLDFFKKVNDTLGHAFGDLVLEQFAMILQQHTGENGLAARFGGEEFVLLLTAADAKESVQRAESVRRATEEHIYTDGKTELKVTCSIGVASYLEHRPENFDRFCIMADQALYVAKEEGRNRVKLFHPTMAKP